MRQSVTDGLNQLMKNSDVKKYFDGAGWRYQVMGSTCTTRYKARCQKPPDRGPDGWRCIWSLPWRSTREEAQADLDQLAAAYGWKEWKSDERIIFRPKKTPLV